jgi:hypothetical protein
MPDDREGLVPLAHQSEVSEAFERKHKEYVQEAERRGEEDGRRNQPPVEATFISPYEKSLRAKYQTALSDLYKQGSQWLQELHDLKVKGLQKQLQDIHNDPELANKKIKTALENRDRQIHQANDNHLDKLKEIENEPSWQAVKRDYEESRDRFETIARKHGRKELYIHIPLWVYIPLLIFIAVCEVPINYQVFVSFRETPMLTLIMAGVLVISLPFLAHGSGKFLRQFSENKTYLVLFIISVLLIVTLSYYTATLRMQYLSTKEGILPDHLRNDFWAFFMISLVLYFVGTIGSFLAHDPSIEFTEVHRHHMPKKLAYEKKDSEKHALERAERERFEREKRQIQDEFSRIKDEWDNIESTLDKALSRAVSEHDKVLVYLQGFEKKINNSFKDAVQLYRDRNMTFRNNHAQPRYWDQDITDLEFEFHHLKELSENPRNN